MPSRKPLSTVLFGYDSSAFTQKARLALRLKRVPYTYVQVPSMMPRPVLSSHFNLTYRKIPVLAIGRDIYCDTSLICEALEFRFPSVDSSGGTGGAGRKGDASGAYGTLYPRDAAGRRNRGLIRGFASHWIDRPFFRVICGLMPGDVWRSGFGRDRAGLIGHVLDAAKLEAKIPRMLAGVDAHLSVLEEGFREGGEWLFGTEKPGLADIALFYQLDWGRKISRGEGLRNLTGGEVPDGTGRGVGEIMNRERYPGLMDWFGRSEAYLESLPLLEDRVEDERASVDLIRQSEMVGLEESMIPTAAPALEELDREVGLVKGVNVSITPDDTGMNDPTHGTLLGLSPEEFVLKSAEIETTPSPIETRLHFPRVGFVCRPRRAAE